MTALRHLASIALVLGAVALPAGEAVVAGTGPVHTPTHVAAVYAERAGSNVLAIAAEVTAEDRLGSTAGVQDRSTLSRRAPQAGGSTAG